jgi:hypothetical protein
LKLAIEVDGGQHAESKRDLARTRIIEGEGYRVLRFWNNDVLVNIDGVLEVIQNAITSTPTPDPSPRGGRMFPTSAMFKWPKSGTPDLGWGGEKKA